MRIVLLALLPGTTILFWQFGWGVLINLLIASITAYLVEAAVLSCRNLPIKHFLTDYSALVSAWLLAVALPPYLPWWITVIAVSAAIIIGKHAYGGLGNNLFNPAMVGYAIAIVAFPLPMTAWPGGELIAQRFDWMIALAHTFSLTPAMDMLSGATPLASWRADLPAGNITVTWLWTNLAFLAGGLWMLLVGIITWHIPLGMLTGITIGASLLHLLDTSYPNAAFHLSNGAIMLGAFFIATDPATAPKSAGAMMIFGLCIGLLLLVFRTGSSYIDGLAFAVLIMNMFKPLLDRYLKPATT